LKVISSLSGVSKAMSSLSDSPGRAELEQDIVDKMRSVIHAKAKGSLKSFANHKEHKENTQRTQR
jgi:hypothetical protein